MMTIDTVLVTLGALLVGAALGALALLGLVVVAIIVHDPGDRR
jgi:hypothetical protein